MRFMIIVRASRAIIPYLIERWLGLNGDTARRIGPVVIGIIIQRRETVQIRKASAIGVDSE